MEKKLTFEQMAAFHREVLADPRVFIKRGKLYLIARDRIFEISDKAIKSYWGEYDPENGFDYGCLTQLVKEFDAADFKPDKGLGKIRRFSSPNLIFRLIGSRIVSARISLKYQSRRFSDSDDEYGADEFVDDEGNPFSPE